MSRFLIGSLLGIVGLGVALAFGLTPQWAVLIGLGIFLVVWLRLYRLDKLLDFIPDPFD